MLGLLKNTYAFALVMALLISAIIWGMSRALDGDPEVSRKKFYQTMAVSLIVGIGLAWLINRPEPVLTEPFVPESIS